MTLTLTPDQESALERSVQSGRFPSREEALKAAFESLDQDSPTSEAVRVRLRAIRTKSLVQLFAESPFAGTDLEFHRDSSPLRDVDF